MPDPAPAATEDQEVLPLTVIIATRNRADSLAETLKCLATQNCVAQRILIVDSSTDEKSKHLVEGFQTEWPAGSDVTHLVADTAGAAPQRNQGVAEATTDFILFLDDDIHFLPGCMRRLWDSLSSGTNVIGATPTYVGDGYQPPGQFGRKLMAFFNGNPLDTYAGRVLGPGFTRVPDASDHLDDVVPIDWMGSGCALYRRDCLPNPPFPDRFQGASLCEDLCLSLRVGKSGQLVNARTAAAIHAHEGGDHKRGRFRLAKMEIENRYYIMRHVLQRRSVIDHIRFAVMMTYMSVGAFRSPKSWGELIPHLAGQISGGVVILLGRTRGSASA